MISDTPPASPQNGQIWWESDTGNTYIYYVDPGGAPGQWVQLNVAPSVLLDHIQSIPADMYAGFKTSGGNRLPSSTTRSTAAALTCSRSPKPVRSNQLAANSATGYPLSRLAGNNAPILLRR